MPASGVGFVVGETEAVPALDADLRWARARQNPRREDADAVGRPVDVVGKDGERARGAIEGVEVEADVGDAPVIRDLDQRLVGTGDVETFDATEQQMGVASVLRSAGQVLDGLDQRLGVSAGMLVKAYPGDLGERAEPREASVLSARVEPASGSEVVHRPLVALPHPGVIEGTLDRERTIDVTQIREQHREQPELPVTGVKRHFELQPGDEAILWKRVDRHPPIDDVRAPIDQRNLATGFEESVAGDLHQRRASGIEKIHRALQAFAQKEPVGRQSRRVVDLDLDLAVPPQGALLESAQKTAAGGRLLGRLPGVAVGAEDDEASHPSARPGITR